MIDNVNSGDAVPMVVRPFLANVLPHCEARLIAKQAENAPGPGKAVKSWDDVSIVDLVGLAMDKVTSADSKIYVGNGDPRQDIADAINYLAMTYDTFDQLYGSNS